MLNEMIAVKTQELCLFCHFFIKIMIIMMIMYTKNRQHDDYRTIHTVGGHSP